jgi:hypothetical protein
MYADDTTIVGEVVSLSLVQALLNNVFLSLQQYYLVNNLTLNNSKTELLILNGNFDSLTFNFGNTTITSSHSVRFLGIHLDSKMKFKNHVENVIANINKSLTFIYRIRDYIPFQSKIMIYHAFCSSYIIYATPFLSLAPKKYLNRLFVSQKRFLKIIFKLPKLTNTIELFNYTKLFDLNNIIEFYC